MKLKHFIMTAVTLLLPVTMQAQTDFEEVVYTPQHTVFKLNSPTSPVKVGSFNGTSEDEEAQKKQVILRLYDSGTGGKPIRTINMRPDGSNVWRAEVRGNLRGKFYTFDTGLGETPGVFAKAVGMNGLRGAIIDMASTNPEGWEEDAKTLKRAIEARNDANPTPIIYEMHFRDFSIDKSSLLKNKGKFLALTEQRAIDHLTRLGITAVHILPSFDFASVDESKPDVPQYNWGYDPLNYNVPEGSYSTNPVNPLNRIREFKQMVAALHRAGIKVVLDVVYNHTYNIEGSAFQRTWPDYFYRKTADGRYSNGSGCGNETASERPLMRKFMVESMKYWVREYHIDGFRVDLMGVHDIETMNTIRRELDAIQPGLILYGEGWSAGTCAYPSDKLATKANIPQMPGIAAFSDDMRDALRGPFSNDRQGAFLAGVSGEEESLKYGIVGGISHPQVDMQMVNYDRTPWATEPQQQISYVSCHDDMCLVDRLRAEIPGISTNELIRLDLLAQTAVFTSQGTPFILSGEEMLRDKKGVHNSFESPDSVNAINWNNMRRWPQVIKYYQGLTELRRKHPAFGGGNARAVRSCLSFLPVQPCLVVFRLKDYPGDSWSDIFVALNGNREPRHISVPQGIYTVVCRNGMIDTFGLGTISGGTVTVPGQSALIFHK